MTANDYDIPLTYDPVDVFLQIELHGALNPSIFRPTWFGDQGLLRPAEVEGAMVGADDDDFMQFQLPDLLIDVNREQFTLISRNEAQNLAHRDMVSSLFDLLRYTPLRGLTISRAAWFAPQPANARLNWETIAPAQAWLTVLGEPSVDRVTVLGSPDVGQFAAELTIEDSNRQEAPLLIRCIYSRLLDDGTEQVGAELEKDWFEIFRHSNRVMNHLNAIIWTSEI
jgi:hypothetical protein